VIAPLLLSSDNPGGNWPEARLMVYGGWPPFTPNVVEYALPVAPLGSVACPVNAGPDATEIVKSFVAVATELSTTYTMNEEIVPAAVPEIRPDASSDSPDGSFPALTDQRYP